MTVAQDIAEAWRRMVPWSQVVHGEYRLEDGYLVGAGNVSAYSPISRPELAGELAKVRSADDALGFVRRYGLLGFARADRTPPLGLDEVVSADVWQEVVQERRQDRQAPGDPIDWFLAHAATVRTIAELSQHLFTGDEPCLARYFDQYRVRQRDDEVIAIRVARGGERRPVLIDFPVNVSTPAALASRIIAELLNDNLTRARRYVDRDRLQSRFGLHALLDVVYWHLADAVTGRQLRQCLACGGIFTATSDRMKYCPPPMGLDGPSRCMNRAKVRRWREERDEPSRKRRRSARRPGRPR